MSFDEAVTQLRKAGLLFLIYTSPSHTLAKPRWRVLAFSSQPQPPTERARLLARVNSLLGGLASDKSWTLSQAYYFGSVNKNPAHRCEYYIGKFIDECADLDEGAIGKAGKPKANGNGASIGGWDGEAFDVDAAVAKIEVGNDRRGALRDLAAHCIDTARTLTGSS